MRGKRIFGEAVRSMLSILETACLDAGTDVGDLDWVIPHQANERIIEAMGSRIAVDPRRVVSRIRNSGNTSSTSIPLALSQIDQELQSGQRIGLCAFGGGFTFAAAILET